MKISRLGLSFFCGAVACSFLVAPAAVGSVIAVSNPSFESPVIGDGNFDTSTPLTGWSNYGDINSASGRDVGVLNPAQPDLYTDAVPDGENVAVVFLLFGGPTESGIQQTLGDNLLTNMRYNLSVSIGNIAPVTGVPFDFSGFPGYRVDLLAGGQVISTDNNTLTPGEGRFLLSTQSIDIGASHAQAGQALAIRLVNLNGPGIEVNFDNVVLTAVPVPEPASVAGVAAGGLGLLAAWRRLRR